LSIAVAIFHCWKATLRRALAVEVCFSVDAAVAVGAVLGIGSETKVLLVFVMLILFVVSEFIVGRIGSINGVDICGVSIDSVGDDSVGVITVAGSVLLAANSTFVIVAALAVVFVAVTAVLFVVE
jgi:hypothetical protein